MNLLIFILGTVIGQLLNWLLDNLSLSEPAAATAAGPARKTVWWRRLPVADALGHRFGAASRSGVSWRVLAVELFCGTGFLLAYLKYGKYGLTPQWGVFVFYLCLLLVIAVIDLKERLILNKLVFPAIPLALLLATFFPMGLAAGEAPLDSFLLSLLGGAVAFIILLLPALIWQGGMGWGDVKLAGLVGIATGFPGCLVALGLAIIGGGLLAIALVVSRRKKRRDVIPFGPFICAGALAALVWGEAISAWYLGLIL
ncbi:MAG: A24 family peptidase [Chloroflexota bacterium]